MKTATKTGRLYQLCWGSFQSTENKLLSGTCSFEAGIHSNESPGTMVVNKIINTAYNDHMWLSKSLTVTSFWELTEFSPCRMFCNRLWYNGGTYSLNMHGSMDHVQLYVHNTLPANRHLGKDLCEVSSHLSTVASNVANSKYSLISKRQIKALAGIMHSLYSRYRTRSWY